MESIEMTISGDRIKEIYRMTQGATHPWDFARAIEAECQKPETVTHHPDCECRKTAKTEPTNSLLINDEIGRVGSVAQEPTFDRVHLADGRTRYLAPQDQSAEVEMLREQLAEAEANYSRMIRKHEEANRCTGQYIDKYDALNLDSGVKVASQAQHIAELERKHEVAMTLWNKTITRAEERQSRIAELERQRDTLVDALEGFLEYSGIIEERCDAVATSKARAALASVKDKDAS